MIRLLHVLDAGADEYRLLTLRTLLERLPADEFSQQVASIDARAARRAADVLGRPVLRAERRCHVSLSCGPRLRSIGREHRADILHVWGPDALSSCAAAAEGRRLVVSGIHLGEMDRAVRWLRQIAPAPAVIASGQVARARLAQLGVRSDHLAVIRTAVDFAAISAARQSGIRESLVGPAGPVVLLAGSVRRGDGSFEAMWACAMLQRLLADIRVVMPYGGDEADRLARLAEASHTPRVPVMPGGRYRWTELVAAADVMVVAPAGESDTEPIAWAMAAGLPVIGVARRSIAELIADHSNGLLCRTNAPRGLAAALLRLHEDAGLRRQLAEVARGQAYEVFSVRGFIDNYLAAYRNVLAGRAIGDGVSDMAMVA